MSSIFLTIAIAFVVVLIALALLGISWIITGKLRIRPGACGQDPTKKQSQNENCGTKVSCQLCEKPKKEKK